MKAVLVVCAPDVPPSEIKILRKNLRKVLKGKVRFIVVNYDVNIARIA
jgi:predicted RNA methylase